MAQLENQSLFPSVFAKDLDGNATDLAQIAAGTWRVVQFYRGDW